eukprot:scaffold35588_cov18-Tisochrysis_lutea.AAC.2
MRPVRLLAMCHVMHTEGHAQKVHVQKVSCAHTLAHSAVSSANKTVLGGPPFLVHTVSCAQSVIV